jgi:formate dehydrogenase
LVTYPDPESGHPTKYVRDSIPEIKSYPGGATTPTPKAISFKPGELLGDETGAFGIKSWLESLGHQVVVTTDKEGPNCVFEKELHDADVVLSQPFYPTNLFDCTTVRYCEEAEAVRNGRYRLRPLRPGCGQ